MHLCWDVHPPEPVPASLEAEPSVAIIVTPSVCSPQYVQCFTLGQTIILGLLRCSLCMPKSWNISGVSFFTAQKQGTTNTNPKCPVRACSVQAACEGSGNFTCRLKSIIMTQNLKMWNCQKHLVPLQSCGLCVDYGNCPNPAAWFTNVVQRKSI